MRLSPKAVLLLLFCSSIASCRGHRLEEYALKTSPTRKAANYNNKDYYEFWFESSQRRPRKRRLGQEKDKNDDKKDDTAAPTVSPMTRVPSSKPMIETSAPSIEPSTQEPQSLAPTSYSSAAPSLLATDKTAIATSSPTVLPVESDTVNVQLLNFVITLQDVVDATQLLDALTLYLNNALTEKRTIVVQSIHLELVPAPPTPNNIISYEFSTTAVTTAANNADGLADLLQLEQKSILRDETAIQVFLQENLPAEFYDDISILSIEVGSNAAEEQSADNDDSILKNNTALLIGLSVAALVSICLIAAILYFVLNGVCHNKSQRDKQQWVYCKEKEKKIVTVETITASHEEEEKKEDD